MKLDYSAYIAVQRLRVRSRRSDEAELSKAPTQECCHDFCGVRDSARILREIDSLPGLNMAERTRCSNADCELTRRHAACDIA